MLLFIQLGAAGTFDKDLYGSSDRSNYATSIDAGQGEDAEDALQSRMRQYTAPKEVFDEARTGGGDVDVFADYRRKTIAEREDDYHARRRNLVISPARADPFAAKADGDANSRSYAEVMQERELEREQADIMRKIQMKKREAEEKAGGSSRPLAASIHADSISASAPTSASANDAAAPPARKRNRWDETPVTTSGGADAAPGWGETPKVASGGFDGSETPSKRRSRWDQTPVMSGQGGATPLIQAGLATPMVTNLSQEQMNSLRWEQDIDRRNMAMSDADLDALLPSTGYTILTPPSNYVPLLTPSRKLAATPTPLGMQGFAFQDEEARVPNFDLPIESSAADGTPLKDEDRVQYGKLLKNKREEDLSPEELKDLRIYKLLMRIKNGSPPIRKVALRHITQMAREFGPGPLFNQILPILMTPQLEDQERHLMVKVIDRVLYKLDDMVRPFVHNILVVIEPLLIDEDYYARVEGREIISNLAKAAGLATMIANMRPDIDHSDEYVRNTTARAFAVVASALGIPALLPFLKAVCISKKSWMARHTGVKIVQQIAVLMGPAILPHLKNLVDIVQHGLVDEQQKVRTITALCVAALAEAAAPYGIESFDVVLKPLWKGIRQHRGKGLAAFLKAIGYIIPLMDAEYAEYYTNEVVPILIREFHSQDEEMKKIVLKVIKQCAATDGVKAEYIRSHILNDFFKAFWVRRMALDKRNSKQLVETTVELSHKVGGFEIINRIVDDLKDENELYRRMVMEAIEKVVTANGTADIDQRLEERLMDGMLYAFQEQSAEDSQVILNGFGVVINAIGLRAKPYLLSICSTILWHFRNKSARYAALFCDIFSGSDGRFVSSVRQQAADLITRIAVVMRNCEEEKLLTNLGQVLYEYLGEEYPDVLGSILGALKAVVNVIGMTRMTPSIKELLPALTPILRNRHEKVQENCIDLVGRIADRGAEFVPAREWMRICFELLELLNAHKKGIRRATVNTFGYIAKAIGPQDVLAALLNNLKVQERTNRVCTTVAIAIVAETCGPYTVLPAVMNEYRVPEMNVQNGVLKSLSFMFEYISEMGKDYVYAVTPLLEDALIDRDAVHRQTAAAVVKRASFHVLCFSHVC